MSPTVYRTFAPRDSEEMIDLQCKAYAMPRSQATYFYEKDEVEAMGAFRDGRLVAALDIISFRLRIWDREWPAGGIASVATHVEHRRQGHVANLHRAALERMRERGMWVSALHPFKRAFYRRFGWEHAVDLLHFQIPASDLLGLWDPKNEDRSVSRFERLPLPIEGPVDTGIPARVYDAAVAHHNCPNARNHEWKALTRRLQRREAGGDNVYAYAGFRDGDPVSYAFYTIGPGGSAGAGVSSGTIRVTEAAAVDARAWKDLLGFFGLHSDDAGTLDFYAPVDTPLRLVLPEATRATLQPSMMFRVVDVEEFLNRLDGPGIRDGTGRTELRIGISDPLCPWNNGVFQVVFDGRGAGGTTGKDAKQGSSGSPRVAELRQAGPRESGPREVGAREGERWGAGVRAARVSEEDVSGPDASEADVSMHIATFSCIASGYLSPFQAHELGALTTGDEGALRALAALFPRRVTFTADFY